MIVKETKFEKTSYKCHCIFLLFVRISNSFGFLDCTHMTYIRVKFLNNVVLKVTNMIFSPTRFDFFDLIFLSGENLIFSYINKFLYK